MPTFAQAVLADAPAAYWKLDETSGTTGASQTATNPLTYLNGPTLGAPSLIASDLTGRSMELAGGTSKQHARAVDAANLDFSTALTIEAVVKPRTIPPGAGFASIVSKDGYVLQFNAGQLELKLRNTTGTTGRYKAPAGAVVAGRAQHIVATWDGATAAIYVNGTAVTSQAAVLGTLVNTTWNLTVGSFDGTTENFDGWIDEVAVYPTALSAARVLAHHQALGSLIVDQGPLALTAATALDGSGSLRHGAPLELTAATTLAGAGALYIGSPVALTATSILAGAGAALRGAPLAMALTGVLDGAGAARLGAGPLSLDARATFDGAGVARVGAPLALLADGTLVGLGLVLTGPRPPVAVRLTSLPAVRVAVAAHSALDLRVRALR